MHLGVATRRFRCSVILLGAMLLQAHAFGAGPTQADLNDAARGADWLLPNRDYEGRRYVDLKEITPDNAGRLRKVCAFNSGEITAFAGNPLVWRGTLYLTTVWTTVALNATNCKMVWKHEARGKPSPFKSRGAALKDGKLIRATSDGRLIALNARTGRLVWENRAADAGKGESIVMAPIAFHDMVIAGVGISELGVRGWIGAFRLSNGAPIWKFSTIPGDGDPAADTWSSAESRAKGGGGVWAVAPAIDVEKGLLYVAVGNPAPDLFGDVRQGTNLYTGSMIVLDVRTGKLQWHQQFVPHDLHDYDLTIASPLYQTSVGDKRSSLVAVGGKDGVLRAVDRDSRQEIFSIAVSSRLNADVPPTVDGVYTCPGAIGGMQWNSPAISTRLNRLFVPSVDWCATFKKAEQLVFVPGQLYMGGTVAFDRVEKSRGWLTAIDAATGARAWKYESRRPLVAAVTATSTDLLFTGELTGDFLAIDARDGRVLYRHDVGGPIGNGVITYGVRGKQYVAATSGTAAPFWRVPIAHASVTVFALP